MGTMTLNTSYNHFFKRKHLIQHSNCIENIRQNRTTTRCAGKIPPPGSPPRSQYVQHQMYGVCSHRAILKHQLGILQFDSILTLLRVNANSTVKSTVSKNYPPLQMSITSSRSPRLLTISVDLVSNQRFT